MLMHKHHIVPKHAGGTDDESNLISLTVEDHSEAHRLLYLKHGREEDRIAWLGLSGMITRQEVIKQAQSLGGKRARLNYQPWQGRKTASNWAINKNNLGKTLVAAWTDKARQKRSATKAARGFMQGEKNSNFGLSIYRDSEGNRKRFIRGQQPIGWKLSADWAEDQKDKSNGTYGKKWFNDGKKNFLRKPDDAKNLKPGRLNPGFNQQRKPT